MSDQLALFNTDLTTGDFGQFTLTGWIPPERELSPGEVDHLIEGWGKLTTATHWVLGDLIAYSTDTWQRGRYEQWLPQVPIEKTTLKNVISVCRSVKTSRRREVLSFAHHQEVAPLPDEQQEFFLQQAIDNGWGHKELRTAIQQAKTYRLAEMNWPSGTFPVIYADPPWRYEFPVSSRGGGDLVATTSDREIENQYPTMELDEIKLLPIHTIAADDCILFLWATSPKLAEAMEVIEAWGFTYRTNMVWDKERMGMGYYARQQHELLLIAAKGDIPAPRVEARIPSVVRIKRDNIHSRKPEEFYGIIESMYPDVDKVELFCRTPREGWQTWGNQ